MKLSPDERAAVPRSSASPQAVSPRGVAGVSRSLSPQKSVEVSYFPWLCSPT